MIESEVVFIYKNPYDFKEAFKVAQFDENITIDHGFLKSRLQYGSIDDFQVFSFGIGMLVISDYRGNVVSIYPSSGLIDIYNMLLAFYRKESIGSQTGYAVSEFYRVDPQEDEYGVSIDFGSTELKISTYTNQGTFCQTQFVLGLLGFTNEIVDWYDTKYPLFLESPVRAEVLVLRAKVKEKYLG